MNTITRKLLPAHKEYLAVSRDLLILKTSSGIQRFTDCDSEVLPGKDIRLCFPELIGCEESLAEILQERQDSLELKGIARFKEPSSPFYIDLSIKSFERGLIVLLEDSTFKILLEQKTLPKKSPMNLFLKTLTASRNYVDKILTSIIDALLVTTQSGIIITANKAALALFEYPPEELINQSISKIIPDENFFLLGTEQNPLSQSKFLKDDSVVCLTKTGKRLTVAFSSSVIETEIKGLKNFVYIGRDITQRQRSEQLLQVEHTTTRILATSATLSEATTKILSTICSQLEWDLGEFWSVDPQANALRLSSSWHRQSLNFPPFELVSEQIRFLPKLGLPGRIWANGESAWIHDVVHDENFLRTESAAKEGLHGAFGFPIKCGSEVKGVMTFFSRKTQEVQSDFQAMIAVIGSQISQFLLRFQAEAALRESKERFHSAFDYTPIGMALVALDGRWLQVNRSLCEIVGYLEQELLSKTLQDLTYSEDREIDKGYVRQLLLGEIRYFQIEKRYLHQLGHIVWVHLSVSLVRDVQGHPLHFISQIQDITERKQAENDALKQSEERFRSIADSAPVLMWMTDADGLCTYVNQWWLDFTGRTLEQELGFGWTTGIPTLELEHYNTLFHRAFGTRESLWMEHRLRHHTGEHRWILVSGSPQYLGTEFIGYICSCVDITECKNAETIRYESEEGFKSVMNNSAAVAFLKDSEGRILYVNKTLERNFNVKLTDLQGKTDFDWLPEETAKHLRENDIYVLSTSKSTQIVEIIPTPDRCFHYWLVFKFPFTDSQGRQLLGGVAIDITELKLLEQQLFEEKELAQVTLQSIRDAVITTDASGKIKYLNPVAEQLTGWSLQDALAKPLAEVFRVVNETTHLTVENAVEKALRSGCTVGSTKDSVLITRDGTDIAIDESAAPIRAKDGQIIGAVMVFQDVSQTRSMVRQLSWQATHDALTGLFNRKELEQRLQLALSSAKRESQQHAIFYLDLDRFKIVNDTCGHTAGDELLRQVATLFQGSIRSSDTLARLGGDEFGILLEGCPLESALRIANTLLQRIQKFRFVWQDKTFHIGVSIGLVMVNAESLSINSILSTADAACYLAKNKGRNRVHIYQANDSELAQAKGETQWVMRIAQALEENRFCLYQQKIVSTASTQPHREHYEVLLRLNDEMGNVVSPMAFIPAAERYNFMPAIDRWVISQLFARLGQTKWSRCTSESGNYGCIYAINLSSDSINEDQFIDFLREQLALHQIPPQVICFETTETVAIANMGKAASLIHSLKELGCRFGLDDFGSGMSSFSYLKHLPVDYLKIDGSFVRHIVEEQIDLAMVQAINQIGHLMGIQTIAKFVENEDIFEKIKAIGVDYAQGYGIAKPQPLCFN